LSVIDHNKIWFSGAVAGLFRSAICCRGQHRDRRYFLPVGIENGNLALSRWRLSCYVGGNNCGLSNRIGFIAAFQPGRVNQPMTIFDIEKKVRHWELLGDRISEGVQLFHFAAGCSVRQREELTTKCRVRLKRGVKMGRFYFHIKEGDQLILDEEGTGAGLMGSSRPAIGD
jgi:hypothetical protein